MSSSGLGRRPRERIDTQGRVQPKDKGRDWSDVSKNPVMLGTATTIRNEEKGLQHLLPQRFQKKPILLKS